MAVWAIGDIQGCYQSLQTLLQKIEFDQKKDRLWIAGDLVNRGQGSLEVLEYLHSIRDSVEVVLGNHDISLIAAYYGIKKSNPTIDTILNSPEVEKLIDWLRSQPLFVVDYKLGYCMAHAGVSPEFDLGMALHYAQKVEQRLQGSDVKEWLSEVLSRGASKFNQKASNEELERYILSAFTRMRFVYQDQRLEFNQKGAPLESLEKRGLKPWFLSNNRKSIDLKIVFGHWSTLGFYEDEHVLALDTGCIWEGKLTAARIDIKKPSIVSVECGNLSSSKYSPITLG
jgi:bis(5'-nucleosyl)-tetraphosphatase (symmetrical)